MKNYYKIPGGGVQLGYQKLTITIWFKGHCLHLWRGSVWCWFTDHKWEMRFPEDTRLCKRCCKLE